MKTEIAPAERSHSGIKAVVTAALILVFFGVGYRVLLAKMNYQLTQSVKLNAPLTTLPVELGAWRGTDVELDAASRRIIDDDEFVNRAYRHDVDPRLLRLYVGYMGHPRSRVGHRVDVCYPANGYQKVSQAKLQIQSAGGTPIPALLYEYRSPQLGGPRDLILVMYLQNGLFVDDPSLVNDYNVRSAGWFGEVTAYATRIQIALQATGDRTGDVTALTGFASVLMDPLLTIMPHIERTKAE